MDERQTCTFCVDGLPRQPWNGQPVLAWFCFDGSSRASRQHVCSITKRIFSFALQLCIARYWYDASDHMIRQLHAPVDHDHGSDISDHSHGTLPALLFSIPASWHMALTVQLREQITKSAASCNMRSYQNSFVCRLYLYPASIQWHTTVAASHIYFVLRAYFVTDTV